VNRIYLACPYTSKSERVMAQRVERATEAAALLMGFGNWVFSPITYGHAIANFMSNHVDGTFWLRHMLPYMEICSHLYILREKGWDKSKGIEREVVEANRIGLAGPIMISIATLKEHEGMKNGTIKD
jgi:hypothetical protein